MRPRAGGGGTWARGREGLRRRLKEGPGGPGAPAEPDGPERRGRAPAPGGRRGAGCGAPSPNPSGLPPPPGQPTSPPPGHGRSRRVTGFWGVRPVCAAPRAQCQAPGLCDPGPRDPGGVSSPAAVGREVCPHLAIVPCFWGTGPGPLGTRRRTKARVG